MRKDGNKLKKIDSIDKEILEFVRKLKFEGGDECKDETHSEQEIGSKGLFDYLQEALIIEEEPEDPEIIQ